MIIYEIKNKKNNKRYIGRAVSTQRWSNHLSDLKLNRHHSTHLQRAWNKYGKDNFKFTIIDNADSIEELSELETYYTLKYKSYDRKFGYNIKIGGVPFKVSDATRKKLRNRSSKSRNFLSKKFRRNVYPKLISPDGKICTIEPSLRYFCKIRGLNRVTMTNLIQGRLQSCKGWTVKGRKTDIKEVQKKRANDISSTRTGGRTLTLKSPTGEVYEVKNLHNFCKDRGLHSGRFTKILNGVQKTNNHNGWNIVKVTYDIGETRWLI